MTFLAFRPFRRGKHRNDFIVTSYIKISQILKLKSKDITKRNVNFCALATSGIKVLALFFGELGQQTKLVRLVKNNTLLPKKNARK